MTVTPQQIKDLREMTGVSIGKCKEALEQAKGDLDEAVSILRKAGIAGAVKKEGRSANEGVIAIGQANGFIAIVEVNAETDFVVKNDRFQQFAQDVANEVASTHPASLESFMGQKFSKGGGLTVDEYRATTIQAIGENIQIRRLKIYKKSSDLSVGVYSHLGGKIVCVAEITGSDKEEELAKNIGMHIAAAAPLYLNPEQVPAELLAKEREIAKEQMKGKPDNVIEKIVDGKISKFYDEVCLERQLYIRDDSVKVGELVAQRAKDTNKPLKLSGFIRWTVGQN